MGEILPKGRLQETNPTQKLESDLYNTNNEVIRVAINVINENINAGSLNSAIKEITNHESLLNEDKTKLELGDRVTVLKDTMDDGSFPPGTGEEYVTYALVLTDNAVGDPTREWVIDSVGVPKASATNDGLLSKDKWSKLDALPTGSDITQSIESLVLADETLEGKVITNEDDIAAVSNVANTLVSSKLNAEAVVGNGFNSTNNGVRIIENRTEIESLKSDNSGSRLTAVETDITNLKQTDIDIKGDAATLKGRVDIIEPVANAADKLSKENAQKIAANKTDADATKALAGQNKVQIDLNTGGIAKNVSDIDANIKAIATNTPGIATNKMDIATNAGNIQKNVTIIGDNGTAIVGLKVEDENQDNRIRALEDAENLEDRVWEDETPISFTGNQTGTVDISAIEDQNSTTFDFEDNKRFEIYIKHTGDNVGQAHTIVVGSTTPIQYVIPIGGQSDAFTISLDTGGIITGTSTNGNVNMSTYSVYRVVEEKAEKKTSDFTEAQADSKYTAKATTTALNTIVGSNTATIGTNTTAIGTNAGDIQTNAGDITAIQKVGTDNTAEITKNTSGIAANKSAIASNTATSNTHETEISKNKTDIGTNTASINTNKTNITANTTKATAADTLSKSNKTQIDLNTAAIAVNKGVIAQLGAKKVSGNGNLLSTAEVLATEKMVNDSITKTAILGILGVTEVIIPIGKRTLWVDYADIASVDLTKWEIRTDIPEGYTTGKGASTGTDKGSIPASTATQAGHSHKVNSAHIESFGFDSGGNPHPITTDGNKPQVTTDTQTPAITISQSVAHNTSGEVKPAIRKGNYYKNKVEIIEYVKA